MNIKRTLLGLVTYLALTFLALGHGHVLSLL